MEVEWETIAALGRTRGVDLWLLFPLGQAVNRVLTKSGPPVGGWADRLTLFFGTEEWKEAFYRRETVNTLFGDQEVMTKDAGFGKIHSFFLERLATAFTCVAQNPLYLRNTRNVPIYLLCFAAASPTALKIASDILRK